MDEWVICNDHHFQHFTVVSWLPDLMEMGIWCLMPLLAIFQFIWWRSVLLVEEIRVAGENHRPAASHWQTLSDYPFSIYSNSSCHLSTIPTHNFIGDRHWLHRTSHTSYKVKIHLHVLGKGVMFDTTFNNISVISWPSVLLMEETGQNHQPASHWQTLSNNGVSST